MRRTLVVVLSAAAVLALPTPVRSEPAARVGWWTRQPGASAPAGGFTVGNAPDGRLSVAAVGLPASGQVVGLQVRESGGTASELAALRVCPTFEAWEPVAGGAWADAPEPQCAGSAALVRHDEGVWEADVSALTTYPTVRSLMVLAAAAPAADSPVPVAAPVFSVTFEAPELHMAPTTEPRHEQQVPPPPESSTGTTVAGPTEEALPAPDAEPFGAYPLSFPTDLPVALTPPETTPPAEGPGAFLPLRRALAPLEDGRLSLAARLLLAAVAAGVAAGGGRHLVTTRGLQLPAVSLRLRRRFDPPTDPGGTR